MRRDRARLAVYALGGVYLLFLAWELFQGLSTAGSEKPLMLVFIVLFTLIGVAAVGIGIYSGWKQIKGLSAAGDVPAETQEIAEETSEEAPEEIKALEENPDDSREQE